MIKCGQVYYAGLNEYHRWGKDAQNKVADALIPNENGWRFPNNYNGLKGE